MKIKLLNCLVNSYSSIEERHQKVIVLDTDELANAMKKRFYSKKQKARIAKELNIKNNISKSARA
jgi:hypothetical protein